MYIAMNRFRVNEGSEAEFEKVWAGRDSQLDEVPGFQEFHLLRGSLVDLHVSDVVGRQFAPQSVQC